MKSTLDASSGDTTGECVGESQSTRNQLRRVTKEKRKNVKKIVRYRRILLISLAANRTESKCNQITNSTSLDEKWWGVRTALV